MSLIAEAVEPLRKIAADDAEAFIWKRINETIEELTANGWDLQKVAPFPNSRTDFGIKYHQKKAKYLFVTSIVNLPSYRRVNDPVIVDISDKKVKEVVSQVKRMAEEQYLMYVAKLESKIGEVASAKLEGTSVWNYSILKIILLNGEKQNWKTQQILNVSKLGKVFAQWPTRKMK